jgi:uroporphyrinogen-III synthase
MAQPVILLTRPKAGSERVAAKLANVEADIIQCPLIEFEEGETAPKGSYGAIVLTSATSAQYCKGFEGMTAYCVGDRTAEIAKTAGLSPISAGGDVEALFDLIVTRSAFETLLHVRGAHHRGDLARRLSKAGVQTDCWIAYRQVPCLLSDKAKTALDGENQVILPLFSPMTARICIEQRPFLAPLSVISLSEAVSVVAQPLNAEWTRVAKAPTMDEMLPLIRQAVRRALSA